MSGTTIRYHSGLSTPRPFSFEIACVAVVEEARGDA
jgi:hypothetical protein